MEYNAKYAKEEQVGGVSSGTCTNTENVAGSFNNGAYGATDCIGGSASDDSSDGVYNYFDDCVSDNGAKHCVNETEAFVMNDDDCLGRCVTKGDGTSYLAINTKKDKDTNHGMKESSGHVTETDNLHEQKWDTRFFEPHATESYSEDKLRFLIHNSSPTALSFFLVFIKKHNSLLKFFKSQLCHIFFKNATLPFLRDIYTHRHYQTSYYRLSDFYPYPDSSMIKKCLACDATEHFILFAWIHALHH